MPTTTHVPTISNDTSRREFLAMVAAAGLLAACGDADSGGAASDDGTRSVSDVFGEVSVPTNPTRVICMEQQTLGNLLAIGFAADHIVGFAAASYPASEFPEVAGLIDLEALDNVGDYAEPNAEAIAATDPDLILLVAESTNDEFYAPILETLRSGGWAVFGAFNGYLSVDDSMRLLADVGVAVGREDEAAAKAREFRDAITAVKERLDSASSASTAGFLRVYPGGILYNTTVPLLTELGVPGNRPSAEEFVVELSAEQIGQLDHDVLFVSDGGDPEETEALLEGNPLWASLPAVQNGRMVLVPDTLWGTSYSVLALEMQLRDIERALLT